MPNSRCRSRSASADTRLIGPSRPMNISATRTTWPAGGSFGDTRGQPTVANADTVSWQHASKDSLLISISTSV